MSTPRTVEQATPLLEWLFATWPEAKRNTVRGWLKNRQVMVNGRVVSQFDHALRPDDAVTIGSQPQTAPGTRLPGGILIRYEDDALLVVEKPAGLRSIATEAESDATAYAQLTEHVRRGNPRSRERVWIVHRLDQETSGLMVFARNEEVKRLLQENWDAVEKKYRAVVEGAPPKESGVLDSHLDESDRFRVRATSESPFTRRAVTRYRVEKHAPVPRPSAESGRGAAATPAEGRKFAGRTLVELTLETGRRHQIRVQLAEVGCPIVGDERYGAPGDPIKRVALHACSLRFTHPVTKEKMRFVSPLPGEFGRLMK
jgi:23S rRNA pseudouridine1911/1915/1917 synthase